MAFDFPSSPTSGQIYTPTGGPAYQWDGEKWRGGQPSGPQTEQFFDCSGLTVQDIVVPTWARAAHIEGSIYVNQQNWILLRVSEDGTTFKAGTSDYGIAGPMHYSGTSGYAAQAGANISGMWFTQSGDTPGFAHQFTADIDVARPAGTSYFVMRSYAHSYDSATAGKSSTFWLFSYPNANTVTQLKALRILLGLAGSFGAGSWIRVKWFGNDAQVPISNAIADAPSDNGEYTRVNGIWRLVKQSFDLNGKTSQDVLVPAWGPQQARLTAFTHLVSGTSSFGVRVSADGVTYAAGASDYTFGGFVHNSGTLGSVTAAVLATTLWPITGTHDNTSLPLRAVADINLTRPTATPSAFAIAARGSCYNNAATSQFVTTLYQGYTGVSVIGSVLRIGGLRLIIGSAGLAGSLDVEWLA